MYICALDVHTSVTWRTQYQCKRGVFADAWRLRPRSTQYFVERGPRRSQGLVPTSALGIGSDAFSVANVSLPRSFSARTQRNNSSRRTRVVGAFPDAQSALNLAAARLRHVAELQKSCYEFFG